MFTLSLREALASWQSTVFECSRCIEILCSLIATLVHSLATMLELRFQSRILGQLSASLMSPIPCATKDKLSLIWYHIDIFQRGNDENPCFIFCNFCHFVDVGLRLSAQGNSRRDWLPKGKYRVSRWRAVDYTQLLGRTLRRTRVCLFKCACRFCWWQKRTHCHWKRQIGRYMLASYR